ncbi:NAD(P)/FAD-dependent oxidoreductase [Marinomonas posidonica]|uniref:Lycopene beta and epsilon cyclase n=1 Tax=Marinomonas posidonica (strain CECT 7376 / NCIMB 14433 / IVIA-Po-181) TaxID=491952 RepID=F6CYP8_MARPP|nr:FAD-dependent oxidoreductase [Marinomonas posidonica]AEF55730.1 Lycopene beta and epsilon cyclase [Marinomonas posidonica IVIA-Po-181]
MKTSTTIQQDIPTFDVAIIGAGLAGSLCAKQLSSAGFSVCVIDKSRGSGGRAGSKKLSDTSSCELGTPYIFASHPETKSLFKSLAKQGIAAQWKQISSKKALGFVGTPKMSSITRHWLDQIPFMTSTKVQQMDHLTNKEGQSFWLLRNDQYQVCAKAGKVIIATPAHQAAMLLATHADLAVLLLRANQACKQYQSQWAMWLETQPSDLNAIIELKDSPIQRMIKDNYKPGREGLEVDRWVIQTSPEWTAQHLEQDKQWIAQTLQQAFAEHTEQRVRQHGEPHRWLFSRYAENRGNKTYAWAPEHQVGLAADWLCQGDAEGALISALTLTDWIINNPASL